MDTLCGVGLPELLVLAVVGFIVIGPERSREVALTIGRWLRKVISSPWWREFNDVANAIRDLPNTLVRMADLEDDLRRVQTDLTKTASPSVTRPVSSSPSASSETNPWGMPGTFSSEPKSEESTEGDLNE